MNCLQNCYLNTCKILTICLAVVLAILGLITAITSVGYQVVLLGQPLFSCGSVTACSISALREKGLVRFTGLIGTKTTIVVN